MTKAASLAGAVIQVSSAGTNIYIANADGTGLIQVTTDGGDDDPSWGTRPLAG